MDSGALGEWWSGIDVLRTALLCAGVVLALLLLGWLTRRLKRPKIVAVEGDDGGCGICRWVAGRLERLFAAIDYLATRREWRYAQPWVLVLGQRAAGKSSLIGSLSEGLRYRPPARAAELKADGLEWHYLRAGVLIDSDGALASAGPGTPEARRWEAGLDALDALRPERALDGAVLCISAGALRLTGRSGREALGVEAARQLEQLQAATDFILPIYVVVTRCDEIPGFSAFWCAVGGERHAGMFGYSSDDQDKERTPAEWMAHACDRVGGRLRELQVDAAAHREYIEDVDRFFLFPGHFRALREPLGQWLETVFRPTAWQSGHLLRGVYFTGSVEADGERSDAGRGDVDFVDTLVAEKVLREVALARPTRRGVWSRNRLLRSLQVAMLFAAVGAFAALGVATYRVHAQTGAIADSLAELDQVARRIPPAGSGQCLAAGDVYPLLVQIGRIDTRSRYPAIPMSWVDDRITTRTAKAIGASSVEKILMPTLACRLEKRSAELLADSTLLPGPSLAERRADFRSLVVETRRLEANLLRFRALSQSGEHFEEKRILDALDALALYAFGQALPETAKRPGGVLDDAFRQPMDVDAPQLRTNLRPTLAARIQQRAALLRQAMSIEVGIGDDLISSLDRGERPILFKTRRLGEWMAWVESEWLGSTAERSPCQAIVQANDLDVRTLVSMSAEYETLTPVLQDFGDAQCRRPEMDRLRSMTLSPYGPMFVNIGGRLEMAPGLRRELGGLPDLARQPFMQLRSVADFSCMGTAVAWRAQEIIEAQSYLQQYEAFTQSHPATDDMPVGARPLYQRLALQSLGLAMDDALRRAQQAPPGGAYAVDAPTPSDSVLAESGGELARGLDPLLKVFAAYDSLGFADGGARVRQCASDFAADHLGSVDALAEASRLYAPQPPASGDALFAFGSLPVVRDFLQRQLARAEVLGSYAQPFLALIDGAGADTAARQNQQTADYWRNTLAEIERYTKGKEPAGQVANLDALFVDQLTGMTYDNCAARLAAYVPPESGNDLFSARRRSLEAAVALRCSDRRGADAARLYEDLAVRFNRDLAGRYPFAALGARDASPAAVRAFFVDYLADNGTGRDAVKSALRGQSGERWRQARAFVEALDDVAAFFASTLAAPDADAALGLDAVFPADAGRATGAEQLVSWRFSADTDAAVFPNGLKPLSWYPGEPVALQLRWAARSPWRPMADPRQPDLRSEGVAATFGEAGGWALLRMIERHRVPGTGLSPQHPLTLRFAVPTVHLPADIAAETNADRRSHGKHATPVAAVPQTAQAQVYLHLRLFADDPTTKTETDLQLPAAFPRAAPGIE